MLLGERICLVSVAGSGENPRRVYEHLGMGYVAAILRQRGFQVTILDNNIMKRDILGIVRQVKSLNPTLIGLTSYQRHYPMLRDVIHHLRKECPHAHISMGGVFATAAADRILADLDGLDSLVMGDGEFSFSELAATTQGGSAWCGIPGVAHTEDGHLLAVPREPVRDLDALPLPARDTLKEVMGRWQSVPILVASRGCTGRCSFCSISGTVRGVRRVRSPEAVLDEMEQVTKDYDADMVEFADDTFIGSTAADRARIEEWARRKLRRGLRTRFAIECRVNEVDRGLFVLLKEAGLVRVFVGVESAWAPTLKLFEKGTTVQQGEAAVRTINDLGITLQVGMIMFHPFVAAKELLANLRFLSGVGQIQLLKNLPNTLEVLVGSRLESRLSRLGTISGPWYAPSYELPRAIYRLHSVFYDANCRLAPLLGRMKEEYERSRDPRLRTLYSRVCSGFLEMSMDYLTSGGKLEELYENILRLASDLPPAL